MAVNYVAARTTCTPHTRTIHFERKKRNMLFEFVDGAGKSSTPEQQCRKLASTIVCVLDCLDVAKGAPDT